VLEVAPDDEEALRWLARIAFERGDAEGAEVAARLWERLLEVTPDDETARYHLERSRQRVAVRVAACDSFHAGVAGFEGGVLEGAPDDEEALRWLARIAFERGDAEGAEVAARLWERLLEVTPDDETARYYLERSRQRVAVGVAASDSFHAGVAEYEAGDLEGA